MAPDDGVEEQTNAVEEAADEVLDTDDAATPFTKREVVATIKEKLRMQDSRTRDRLLEGYGERIDRRQFLKFLGFTAGGAVIASGTGFLMGKKVFSDTSRFTITGMQTGNCSPDTISSPESVGSGETLDGALIDGADVQMDAQQSFISVGSNATVRNIGVDGTVEPECAPIIGINGSGTITVGNVYLGDGSEPSPGDTESFCNQRGANGHGITGIFVHKNTSGTVNLQSCNIQNMQDNSIYASAPGGSATVNIENCFSANSYVSSFRLAQGSIRNSVALNDGGRFAGRPVWVWSPGPVTIQESHFAAGSYGAAIVADGTVNFESGAYSGDIQGDVQTGSSVGSDPDLTLDNIPKSAEQAACGEGGSVTAPTTVDEGNGEDSGGENGGTSPC